MIADILKQLRETTGSNAKVAILKEHKTNELLSRVLVLAYDKVRFTYGVTLKTITDALPNDNDYTLDMALDVLENTIATRVETGNTAIDTVRDLVGGMPDDDTRNILECIINRDLRLDMGVTQINKAIPKLITQHPYMRCSVFSKDTKVKGKVIKGTYHKISYPALCQLKADGTYRAMRVESNHITFFSRSGIEYEYPLHATAAAHLDEGVYVGEMLVKGISNRAEANGLLNSLTPPHDQIIFQLWDCIPLEEYRDAKHSDKTIKRIPYVDRFNRLIAMIASLNDTNGLFSIIDTHTVNTLDEAVQHTIDWMNSGREGAVLKDMNGIFKNHTSPTQLKMKITFGLEVRVTGFVEGKPGTKRAKTFGSLKYATDDGKIQGSVSGFSDAQLKDFNSRREDILDTIIEIEGNDLTQSDKNDFYAVSHPRFITERDDRDDTDTLERAMASLEMGKQFK